MLVKGLPLFNRSLETMSQSPSSTYADQNEAYQSGLEMEDRLLFLDSLKDLKNIRSHLYSAAEYFELSYINDDQKQIVIGTLKDYTAKALANTVDHLGSVSYKVKDLVGEEVDEVSVAEFRISCIEQRLRTCQESIDKNGFSQQSLIIKAPRYHKHYRLQSEEMAFKCDAKPASQYQAVHQHKEVNKGDQFKTAGVMALMSDAQSTSQWQAVDIHKEVNTRKLLKTEVCVTSYSQPSIIRPVKSSSMSPSPQKTRSISPVKKVYSPPPSPRHNKMVSSKEGWTISPVRSFSTITRNRSATYNFPKQHSLDSKDSTKLHMATERNNQKDGDRNPVKGRGFLKSLLTRQKSSADDLLYRYLDEY